MRRKKADSIGPASSCDRCMEAVWNTRLDLVCRKGSLPTGCRVSARATAGRLINLDRLARQIRLGETDMTSIPYFRGFRRAISGIPFKDLPGGVDTMSGSQFRCGYVDGTVLGCND